LIYGTQVDVHLRIRKVIAGLLAAALNGTVRFLCNPITTLCGFGSSIRG
jgi:hypothetical protein